MIKSLNCTRVQAPNSLVGNVDQFDEDSTLNPLGRVEDDTLDFTRRPTSSYENKENVEKNNKTPKNFNSIITCRSYTYIATFNIRTARENFKRLELVECFLQSGIQVLGLQEHRIVHDEPIRIEKLSKGVALITSSAWRNTMGAATGGVGVLVTRDAYSSITLIKSFGSRTLTVSFDGNPRLTVVNSYSPTEAASDEAAEEFHNNLRLANSEVPDHHLLLSVGDMNARMGKANSEDPGWYFHERTNRNGQLLRDTLLEGNLEATNHRFQKRPGKLWTFMSDGTLSKGQIDYICIRKKWRNSLKNTEAYNFFSSLGSDHRVVVCKIKLSLRKSKNPPRHINFNYSVLKRDQVLQDRYAVEVANRYACLMEDGASEEDATAHYSKLVAAVQDTSKLLIPVKPRLKPTNPAADPRVLEQREDLYKAKEQYHLDPTEDNRSSVSEKKDLLKTCYNTVEGEILANKIYSIENSADRCDNKKSWDIVNDVTGKKKGNCGLIEGGSAAERLKNWEAHFINLLGQPPTVPDEDVEIPAIHPLQDINTDPFDRGELAEAKKQISEGKAYGDDAIPPEVMKRVDMDEIVLDFCNRALCNGEVPEQWKTSIIVPVPKKGDLTKTDNYRGISLTSIISKTMNRMILNRLKPSLENILRINQNGFRPGRSTTGHILALRRILEGARAKNLPAVMAFIDFKKAFDSVHRGMLMKILRAYGIPDPIVNLIDRMYTGTRAKIITGDGLTELFEILAGVLQGDTLAPYLFIIVVDYIMTTVLAAEGDVGFTITPSRSRRHKAEKLADAEFADDVALISDSIAEAQQLLQSLETAAKQVGLYMNEGKTKYLCVNIPEEHEDIVSSSGNIIDEVKDFVYLGAWVGSSEHDFSVKKAKAWGACHRMKNIWKSKLRRTLKIRLFQATVEPILLYGSETWTMTKALSKRIDGCYTRMLRMALNISHKARLNNNEVYGSLPRVTFKIQQRRLRLAGHTMRHDDLVGNKLLLWEPNHGRRGRGRPALTFVDTLRSDLSLDSTNEMGKLMADRQLWRKIIATRTRKPP